MTIDKDSLWELRQIVENANRLETILKDKNKEVSDLKKEFGVVQSFNTYPTFKIKTYSGGWGGIETGNIYELKKYLKPDFVEEKLNEWKKVCEEIKLKNLPLCQINSELRDKTKKLLTNIGLKSLVTKPVGRSRIKTEQVRAEWVNELEKAIPIHDGYYFVDSTYNRTVEEIKKWRKEIADSEAIAKRAEESKNAENKRLNIIATLRVKYNLEPDAEYEEILNHLLGLNKYLHLGHYLEANRNDWNDGCDYAQTGLNGFEVDGDLDDEIYSEISGLINNWDGDGRCFRDCTYNYRYLFDLVNRENPVLYTDYEILNGVK